MKVSNIPQVFLGFLVVSLLFWLLLNLSKEYITQVTFSVSYQNLQQDKLIVNKPQKEIDLFIKGSGFKLISPNFMRKPIVLDLNNLIKKSNSHYYLLGNHLVSEIQKQLTSGITVKSVLQDTIFFKINKLFSKKVPVKPNLNISYKKGFDLAASPIKIKPDSIVISGSKKDLKNITSISTKEINLQNISTNISQKFAIEIPKKIKSNYKTVLLNLIVENFTEGEIELPITIINLPKNGRVSTFPKSVTVIYKVVLKNFNKINSKSFEVYCDYNEAIENNLPYLVPKLKTHTKLVSSARITPNKIDFLIRK